MTRNVCVSLAPLLLFFAACSDDGFSDGGPEDCIGGEQRCRGNVREGCKDGQWVALETCEKVCSPSLKRCADCDPNTDVCQGDDLHACTTDGTVGEKLRTCPDGQCADGRCTDPCSQAAAGHSYIGCEYWPTVTSNAGLATEFQFAVVVANPQPQPVLVTVSSADNPKVAEVGVEAESVQTITLPWIEELRNPVVNGTELGSKLVAGGGLRLTSTLPVTVYQFNPLHYVLAGDCSGYDPVPLDNKCHSYTNDASLLLPEGALGQEYIVISRPTMFAKSLLGEQLTSPGFFAVVGTRPGETTVTVEFAGTTQIGSGPLGAYSIGEKVDFKLPHRGVLQILSNIPGDCVPQSSDGQAQYCNLVDSTDLTGTIITANQDVAVFSGHDCTFVPFDKWACDHLEEQLFPVAAWGKRYIGTHPLSSGEDPAIYRVVSAEGDNTIEFTNGVHETVKLQRGAFVEFVTDKHFEVQGEGKFALVQYMVGQNYSGSTSAEAPGDPAMALAVPVEQFRTSYRFLAPESFEQSYVNVIAREGASVQLDGAEVSGFEEIPGSVYLVARVAVEGGAHAIEGSTPFGIAVYGVGSYTSYMYPGGLDLRPLE